MSQTIEADKAIIHRFWDLMGRHLKGQPALEAWLDLWHADGVYQQPYPVAGKSGLVVGKPAIAAYVAPMSMAFEAVVLDDLEVSATDDPGLYLVRTGSQATIRSTGLPYRQRYLFLFRIHGGLIVQWDEYFNPLNVMKAFALTSESQPAA